MVRVESPPEHWPGQPIATSRRLAISERDRRIIDGARARLGERRADFDDAMRALRDAVEEEIPDGRIFVLGRTEHGPILGSIISGVGIVDDPAGVRVVRTRPGDSLCVLASLAR